MTNIGRAAAGITHIFRSLAEPVARRVLIVDDEASIRHAMGKFLRSRGYEVAEADSGAAAIALLQKNQFAAMLCDVRMPGMSGVDVVPRALELWPDLAILMLTAVNDASTATSVLARGVLDYLMKPVELDDLARALERALDRREIESQQRQVERLVREEVTACTEELRREQVALSVAAAGALGALVNAHEAGRRFLRGHSQRVAAMAAAIGSALQLGGEEVEDLRLAGLLHDVGEIGIPDGLLDKPGPLTASERAVAREHVRAGIEILTPLKPLARILPAIRDHHEHWNGSGYPAGTSGEGISLGGRILAAADAYDALTSARPYREPLPGPGAVEALAAHAGTQFDPAVFAALRGVVAALETS